MPYAEDKGNTYVLQDDRYASSNTVVGTSNVTYYWINVCLVIVVLKSAIEVCLFKNKPEIQQLRAAE